ncbi:MAG: DUF362 domain-containing protein [Armatimonadota bacterium]|nr:DUF362 domain-containing protein [Armatimonadota bacterium]
MVMALTPSRRSFLKMAAATGATLALSRWPSWACAAPTARVALIKTDDHRDGVLRALRLVDPLTVQGKSVVIKPNFNSAHAFPGSTHPETLRTLLEICRAGGAREITIADRSGMGDTPRVIREKGVEALAGQVGARVVALETQPAAAWRRRAIPGGHWRQGVLFPALFEQADVLISTCCLKTHRFGGQFTLSLKNSVGMVARQGPDGYDYMRELHGSPLQRTLIAELNTLYRPTMVVLDGIEAFVDGGPEAGTLARPGVVLAGTDRVAIDAVGVAVLRRHGAAGPVAAGRIADQEQIRRAAELGLGVASADAIEILSDSAEGRAVAAEVKTELARS